MYTDEPDDLVKRVETHTVSSVEIKNTHKVVLNYKPGSDLPFFDKKEGQTRRVEKGVCMESVTC